MFTATDWPAIEFVVFDVDGTLYDQARVQFAIARALTLHGLRRWSLRPITALSAFRRTHEAVGTDEVEGDFEDIVIEIAARAAKCDRDLLSELVREWLGRRPLPHVAKARAPGVEQLFSVLRSSGRAIGVWSDYPAVEKLAALGLQADFVVAATDPGIRRLKPRPDGLIELMGRAGVRPGATLMIGDRSDRDGLAAARVGASFLLRSKKPALGVSTFWKYDDRIFRALLD